MKRCLRYFLIIVSVFTIMFVFSACNNEGGNEVISIEKTSSIDYVDTYTITYANGRTYCFTVTNGKNGTNGTNGNDGKNYDINDIYESAKIAGFKGDFLEFLKVYLDYDANSDLKTISINKSLLSVVSVYCKFTETRRVQIGWNKFETQDVEVTSAGSGVIYSLDKENGNAYIITNYHVIYDENSKQENGISINISIYLYGYESEESSITTNYFGGSMEHDIAVLKVNNSDILKNSDAEAVTYTDSNNIKVGETAIAIGNPEALGISATSGIVSVDSEYISMTSLDGKSTISHRVIRVDTAINSGNSGGGLFNSKGELIGIVNAKISDSSIENIGYAIPSNIATNIAGNIIANNGKFTRVVLGIELVTKNTKSVYDSETKLVNIVEDVVIKSINSNSLASSLEFNVDDKIIAVLINEKKIMINRLFEIIDYLYTAKENDNIIINVERNLEEKVFEFRVNKNCLQVY